MRYLFEEALSNIKHGGFVSLLSVIIISLTIAIACALILIGNYLHREVEGLRDEPAIIAFLKDTLDESEGLQLRSQIEKLDFIDRVNYVSKAEALARSESAFGELGSIIMQGFEEMNPLPASLEIHVDANYLEHDHETLEQLALHIKTYPEVEDVTYEQFSSEFTRKAEIIIFGFGALMSVASIIIVCFAIMLTAYFRREEIRVVRIMGATAWYIRFPLVAQGIFLGLIGSLAGIICFYILFRAFTPRLGVLAFLPFNQLLLIVLGGTLLGLLGSILPLGRYVNV